LTLVKMHNKKLGITYVYESHSYWDKEKKQPRNERKLIGKLDPVTGEIIPTGKPGRWGSGKSNSSKQTENEHKDVHSDSVESLKRTISEMVEKIKVLENECKQKNAIIDRIRSITDKNNGGRVE